MELLGEHAGWLALQSAIAVHADVALIPEIPYDLAKVAKKLREKLCNGRNHGLVVVAEGAASAIVPQAASDSQSSKALRALRPVLPATLGRTSFTAQARLPKPWRWNSSA